MIRDKNEWILKVKIASSLFVQIDNPNLSNMNILQDNEDISRVVHPP